MWLASLQNSIMSSIPVLGEAVYPYDFPILSVNSTDIGNDSNDWTLGGGTPTIFAYQDRWSLGQSSTQNQVMPYAYQSFLVPENYWDDIDQGACYLDMSCMTRYDTANDTESHAMYVDFFDATETRNLGRECTFPATTTIVREKQHRAWVRPGTRIIHIGWLASIGVSGTGTNSSIGDFVATLVLDRQYEDAFMQYAGIPNTNSASWVHTSGMVTVPNNRDFEYAHDYPGFTGPSTATSFAYIDVNIDPSWAARVATGNVIARGEYLYTNANDDDEAQMFLQFYTSGGSFISSVRQGDNDPIIDNYLAHRKFYGRIPSNCGRIRIRIDFRRADGSYLDAYVYGMTCALLESPTNHAGLIRFCDGNDPATNAVALTLTTSQLYQVQRVDVNRDPFGSRVTITENGNSHGPNTIELGNWNIESVVWTGSVYDVLWWNWNSHSLAQWTCNISGVRLTNNATTTAAAASRGHDVRWLEGFYN